MVATYLSGNVQRATANSRQAAARSAANRQCPACKRKSAMVRFSDAEAFGEGCRWCGHVRKIDRATGEATGY